MAVDLGRFSYSHHNSRAMFPRSPTSHPTPAVYLVYLTLEYSNWRCCVPSEKKDYFCQTRVDAKAGGNGSPAKQWQLLVGALKTIKVRLVAKEVCRSTQRCHPFEGLFCILTFAQKHLNISSLSHVTNVFFSAEVGLSLVELSQHKPRTPGHTAFVRSPVEYPWFQRDSL